MRAAHDDVERNAGGGEAVSAVSDELDVTKPLAEASTATGLALTECVAEAVRARRDLCA
jgi:hypothetical protein